MFGEHHDEAMTELKSTDLDFLEMIYLNMAETGRT